MSKTPLFPEESFPAFLPFRSKEVRAHDAEKLRQDFIKSKVTSNPSLFRQLVSTEVTQDEQ